MDWMNWLLLAAGLLTGGVSMPILGPLLKKLTPGGSSSSPGGIVSQDLILATLRIVDGLLHKYLNQSAPPAPPPPPTLPVPAPNLVGDLERLLASLRASPLPASPLPAPVSAT